MNTFSFKRHTVHMLAAVSLAAWACAGFKSMAETLPASTTLPVEFTTTIEAGKVTANEPVWARTMQVVLLPNGEQIPKGSIVSGHIVQSKPFVFNSSPYEKQRPSVLGIHFDKIQANNTTWDVDLSVRAMASVLEANQAKTPQGTDESDWPGMWIQIGGDHYLLHGQAVYSRDGDIVGYKRKDGIFARLISDSQFSGNSTLSCNSSTTEQSVGIFSAGACGLYGFADVAMTANGNENGGTFRLESTHHTVKLYSHSAALLEQVNPVEAQSASAMGQ